MAYTVYDSDTPRHRPNPILGNTNPSTVRCALLCPPPSPAPDSRRRPATPGQDLANYHSLRAEPQPWVSGRSWRDAELLMATFSEILNACCHSALSTNRRRVSLFCIRGRGGEGDSEQEGAKGDHWTNRGHAPEWINKYWINKYSRQAYSSRRQENKQVTKATQTNK